MHYTFYIIKPCQDLNRFHVSVARGLTHSPAYRELSISLLLAISLREAWLILGVNIPQILLLLQPKDFIQLLLYELIHRPAQDTLNPGNIYATKYTWTTRNIAANIPAVQATQYIMAISSITTNGSTNIDLRKEKSWTLKTNIPNQAPISSNFLQLVYIFLWPSVCLALNLLHEPHHFSINCCFWMHCTFRKLYMKLSVGFLL